MKLIDESDSLWHRQLLFLEYGVALPFNGGPLIYVSHRRQLLLYLTGFFQLDEVFRHPRLLFAILFAVHEIFFASTAGNSRYLAINILVIANQHSPNTPASEDVIKLTAFVVQSVACIIWFLSRRTCFVCNFPFAVMKVGFFLILAICGFAISSSKHEGQFQWGKETGYSGINALSAMNLIILSYQGFEEIGNVSYPFHYLNLSD